MEAVLGILPEEKPGHRQQGEELDEISGGAVPEENAPVEEKKRKTIRKILSVKNSNTV